MICRFTLGVQLPALSAPEPWKFHETTVLIDGVNFVPLLFLVDSASNRRNAGYDTRFINYLHPSPLFLFCHSILGGVMKRCVANVQVQDYFLSQSACPEV